MSSEEIFKAVVIAGINSITAGLLGWIYERFVNSTQSGAILLSSVVSAFVATVVSIVVWQIAAGPAAVLRESSDKVLVDNCGEAREPPSVVKCMNGASTACAKQGFVTGIYVSGPDKLPDNLPNSPLRVHLYCIR